MSLSKATFGALFLAALPVAAHAQLNVQWVGFQNETSARLFTSDPLVGANDVQEKDFAWADVDHDGDIDFVVVRKVPLSQPGGKRGVLFMNEDGLLVDRTQQYASASDVAGDQGLLTEANNRDVVFADFNNDGWLDFATATTISDVPVVLPKPVSHPRIYMNQGAPGGVWLGFKFEQNRSPQLYVLLANGSPNMSLPYPGRFCGVGAGDVDGDGDIDLYFADYDTGEVGPSEPAGRDLNDRLWLNDGLGNFSDSWQTRMTSQMLQSAFGINSEIRDMNGDLRNEIVKDSALGAPQSVSISYNISGLPNSPFDLYDEPYSASPYFVSVGDLNNDGKLDMVITDDGSDRYLLNTGNDGAGRAMFPTSKTFTFADGGGEGDFGSQSTIADLDGDGWKDVIIADVDVDTESCPPFRRSFIYHNHGTPLPNVELKEEAQQNGGGGWKGAVGITANDLTGVYHTSVFDLDGDGDQDLIIGRCSSNAVWMNTKNPCPTAKFGTVSPNSTGQPARVSFYGSGALTQNLPPGYPDPHSALIFNITNLPPNTAGHLIWSVAKKPTCTPYSHGQLCLQRRTSKEFPVLDTVTADASGHARFVFDFADAPLSDAAAGDHIYFQFQYDDAGAPGGGFNMSEAMDVKVCQ